MNKEVKISPRQIASAITNLLNEKEKLEQENKELQEKYNIRSKAYNNILLENTDLHNKIDKLEDELNWYKQECDDLEMMCGDIDE